jgi:hypothetical protein
MYTEFDRPLQLLEIERGVALSFNAREVCAVTSHLGTLWLTQPGTMSDYFLGAGERFEIAPNAGHIVVEAMDRRARVAVSARSVLHASFTPHVLTRVRETLAAALRRAANWIDAPTPA